MLKFNESIFQEQQQLIQLLSATSMHKTKNSSHTAASSIRPLAISSNFKFQKVEQLNQIVHHITETKQETLNTDIEPVGPSLRQERGGMGDKVLEVLKQRIKTSYDHLYTNYPNNKQKILKHIQTVETNIAGENTMNNKYEEVIKEKSKYDKVKAIVEEKQRKLKKLNDLRTQLKQEASFDNGSHQMASEIQLKFSQCEQKREEIQHNNLILQQMLKMRKDIHLNFREKYNRYCAEIAAKKQKTQKLVLQNHKKKNLIIKTIQNLEKQEQLQIPAKLAEKLSSKIQMYENKHSYNQIIQHQAVLEEERFQKLKQDGAKRREQQRNNKIKKDNEEKNRLQELQNLFMIQNMEQQKLKKLCAVQSIEQVLNCNFNLDQESLGKVSEEIQSQIKKYQQENIQIQTDIEQIISQDNQQHVSVTSVQQLQNRLQQQLKIKRLLQSECQKKQNLANQWLTIMHLINNHKLSKEALTELSTKLMGLQSQRLEGSRGENIKQIPKFKGQPEESIDFD